MKLTLKKVLLFLIIVTLCLASQSRTSSEELAKKEFQRGYTAGYHAATEDGVLSQQSKGE